MTHTSFDGEVRYVLCLASHCCESLKVKDGSFMNASETAEEWGKEVDRQERVASIIDRPSPNCVFFWEWSRIMLN